jgi:hypothetical protein
MENVFMVTYGGLFKKNDVTVPPEDRFFSFFIQDYEKENL